MSSRFLFYLRRPIIYIPLATGSSYAIYNHFSSNNSLTVPYGTAQSRRPPPPWVPPSRDEMLLALRNGKRAMLLKDNRDDDDNNDQFDLLIVGGGATGAGVAVDAASRGLKVALVERDDFASGTSSKSTKLVHGGVRYLQKAVMELDYEQYKLVREALHERKIFLQTAPYLSNMLPIMLPVYKYWQVPYYWAGCKLYDILAGGENMESSYVMSKGKALEAFPMLKADGLVGAVVYYDGQHNDSRMNIALVMTAVQQGAVVANHVEVTSLSKNVSGKLDGAEVRDTLSGKTWRIRAKGIINATGPFTDTLLTLDDPSHNPIVQPSSGIHITLPNYYSPRTMGLLDPATSDGRVIFFLPWQGNTIAGTTDAKASVVRDPRAREEEIRWLLDEVRRYLSPDIKVRRGDVLSAWSGLRPLVLNPHAAEKGGTAGLVRNHIVYVSKSGLLTIAGGKWTTYRAMAEETVDRAVKEFGLERKAGPCVTEHLRLIGSEAWSRNMFIGLIQRYGIETDVAKHLSENYGDRAWAVCALAEPTGSSWPLHGKRISPNYPYISAEILYSMRFEYAQTAIDFIARRCRLAFLNSRTAYDVLPMIIDSMARELGWDSRRKRQEYEGAVRFLSSMGLKFMKDGEKGPAEVIRWRDWLELGNPFIWIEKLLGRDLGLGLLSTSLATAGRSSLYSRAQFDPRELENLRNLFNTHAAAGGQSPKTLSKLDLETLLTQVKGYEQTKPRHLDSVFSLIGLEQNSQIGWNEFLEVRVLPSETVQSLNFPLVCQLCAALKELFAEPYEPVRVSNRISRSIPVEMSGGGV